MNWHILNSSEQIDEIVATSMTKDVVVFKHSTSCSLSYIAKMRLEEQWSFDDSELIPYYLDLKAYRNLSNEIAERFSVPHESPQILLIRKGECLYDASHLDITVAELKETLDWHTHA